MTDTERNDLYQRFLDWRQIEEPCDTCKGTGYRTYPSTSTWRGGMGGQSMTSGVCDGCWGSGDKHNPWTDLRALTKDFDARVHREAADLFARRLGVRFDSARPGIAALADELERLAASRRSRVDALRLATSSLAKLLRELVAAESSA